MLSLRKQLSSRIQSVSLLIIFVCCKLLLFSLQSMPFFFATSVGWSLLTQTVPHLRHSPETLAVVGVVVPVGRTSSSLWPQMHRLTTPQHYLLLFRFESRKESSNQDHWLHLMSSVIPLRLRTAELRCSKITELLHSDFPTIHPRSMGIPEAWLHKMILQLQIVEIDAKRSHQNWNFRKLFASLHTSSARIKELSLLFSHPFHGVHHSFVHLIFTGCWFLNETQKTNRKNTQVSFSCL